MTLTEKIENARHNANHFFHLSMSNYELAEQTAGWQAKRFSTIAYECARDCDNWYKILVWLKSSN